MPGSGHAGVTCTPAATSYPQGLGSEATKTALLTVSEECYGDRESPLFGSRPILFIHDEIIRETPEEAGPAAAGRLEKLMIEGQEIWTPDIPAAATASLMRRWSKAGGDPVFDASGTLIPWEDQNG